MFGLYFGELAFAVVGEGGGGGGPDAGFGLGVDDESYGALELCVGWVAVGDEEEDSFGEEVGEGVVFGVLCGDAFEEDGLPGPQLGRDF